MTPNGKRIVAVLAVWVGVGIWAAWAGYIKIVVFLVSAAVLLVVFQFGIGWLLLGMSRLRSKLKNRKPH